MHMGKRFNIGSSLLLEKPEAATFCEFCLLVYSCLNPVKLKTWGQPPDFCIFNSFVEQGNIGAPDTSEFRRI